MRAIARNSMPRTLGRLLDVSEATSIPQSESLRQVTQEIGGIRSRVQFDSCAIVACGDVLFGMMRMFEVFAEQYFRESYVFRTTSEAEAWLASQHPTTSAAG